MEGRRLRAILVFLQVAEVMTGVEEHHFYLNETEAKTVSPGSSLVFHCSLKTNAAKCRIHLFFERPGPNQTQNLTTDCTNNESRCDTICTKSNITEMDSGRYFCNFIIEIPFYDLIKSNKSEVTVKSLVGNPTVPSQTTKSQVALKPDSNKQDQNLWVWIVIGASFFILLILLIICVVQRRGCSRSADEPIYMNAHQVAMRNKQPSPRPGGQVDNLKTVPSSRDLRTPSPARRYQEGNRRYKD